MIHMYSAAAGNSNQRICGSLQLKSYSLTLSLRELTARVLASVAGVKVIIKLNSLHLL